MKTKEISIKTEQDYKKFIKRLNLYKRIFYYNRYFEVNTAIHQNEIKPMVTALNIKHRKDRIRYIYDSSCHLIDKKYERCDTCGFVNNQCYVQRKLQNNKCNGCCRRCLYQSPNGCRTKNLTCKLFNCSEVRERYDVVQYRDLNILKLFSLKNRIIIQSDYFSSREDVLKDLYSYSILYSGIRIIYRFIKTQIILGKRKRRKDMQKIIIRPIERQDIPAIVDIQISGWKTAYKGIIADDFLASMNREERIAKREKDISEKDFIVATIGDEVVGFSRYTDYPDQIGGFPGIDCELCALYVKPDQKYHGIGTKLVQSVMNEFQKKHKTRMIIWCLKENEPAKTFYHKMGGIISKEKKTDFGGRLYDEVGFVFDLNRKEIV